MCVVLLSYFLYCVNAALASLTRNGSPFAVAFILLLFSFLRTFIFHFEYVGLYCTVSGAASGPNIIIIH